MAAEEDITNGIDSQIIKAGYKAIDNSSKEAFVVLANFIHEIAQESLINDSLKHFIQYTYIPPILYSYAVQKKKEDAKLTRIYNMSLEHCSQILRSLIWHEIRAIRRSLTGLENERITNNYYYCSYNNFSRLLYYIVINNDISGFHTAMSFFDQISDSMYDDNNYKLLSEIRMLEFKKDPAESEKLKELKIEYEIKNKFYVYKRHVLLGIRYWTFFLYKNEAVDLELVEAVISRTDVQYNNPKDAIEDALFFKNSSRRYFEWDTWQYKSKDGKTHSIFNSGPWLTSGFYIDQIRNNTILINPSELSIDEMRDLEFLLQEIVGYHNEQPLNIDRWKNILKVNTQEEYNNKAEPLKRMLSSITTNRTRTTERTIAEAELSNAAITNFRTLIGEAWKSQAKIARLFKSFGNREDVTETGVILNQFAISTFFERAKTMFIDGNHHQQIYGVEQWGGQIGRWEDEDFFNKALNSGARKISGNTLSDTIKKSLEMMRHSGMKSTAILMSPEHSYNELYSDENFVPNTNRQDETDELSSIRLGTFNEIPIYFSYSNFLKNKIITCDFKNAFKMLYKTNQAWYDNELRVEVLPITDEQARERLSRESFKWTLDDNNATLTEDEALLRIKNSVLINIAAILDFQITNIEFYVIGNVTPRAFE